MNKSFDSEYIKNLAAGFVVDDLTPEEAEEFRLLLDEHPELVGEIEDLQEVLRQVLDGFTSVEPPANLLPKILAQANAVTSQATVNNIQIKENNQKILGRLPRKLAIITSSIAALLVAILGIDNFRLRQNLGLLNTENQRLRQDFAQAQAVKSLLQNSQTRLFTFEAVNSRNNNTNNSSGSVIINPQKQKAVMVFQNLPAPPPGHVYLLWTVINNEKLPCGQVKPYSWGTASYELQFTNQMYKEFVHPQFSGLVVTLETDANVSRPMGTVVMQSLQI